MLTPPEILRGRPEVLRREGVAFDDAWARALSRGAENELHPASAWRRAYGREPATPSERAVGALLAALEDQDHQ